jgi:DNA-binding SARP family transcriptional activator
MSRLIDELWPEEPPETAANTVQVYVSRIRRALGKDAVQSDPAGYALNVEPSDLDVAEFERLCDAGQHALVSGDPRAAGHLLRSALRLWRGAALADVAPGVAGAVAVGLEARRRSAFEQRVEADLSAGGSGELVPELEVAFAAEPLRERLGWLLMLALSRAGRRADA